MACINVLVFNSILHVFCSALYYFENRATFEVSMNITYQPGIQRATFSTNSAFINPGQFAIRTIPLNAISLLIFSYPFFYFFCLNLDIAVTFFALRQGKITQIGDPISFAIANANACFQTNGVNNFQITCPKSMKGLYFLFAKILFIVCRFEFIDSSKKIKKITSIITN